MRLNKILSGFLLSTLFLLSSCADLDKEPLGQARAGKIASEALAFKSLTAVYSDFKDFRYTWSMQAFGDILSDDATHSGSDEDVNQFQLMEQYAYPADHSQIRNKYTFSYYCINKANQIIKDLEEADDNLFEKYNKKQMIGEAKFLRAYSYFELVKIYGGVPLWTEPQDMNHERLKRATVEQVYEVINSDLEYAANILPTKGDVDYNTYAGRITKGAAYAMQTRVFLYQKKYSDVRTAAKNLFNLNEYELVSKDDYAKQFRLEGEHSSESILEINMYTSKTSTGYGSNNGNRHVLMSLPRTLTMGFGCAQPTNLLAKAFDDAGDAIRKEASLISSSTAVQIEKAANPKASDLSGDRTGWYNRKLYLGPGERYENAGNNQPLNHKLIRLSEVYLNYAEACAMDATKDEPEARKYLNLIRNRVGLSDNTSSGQQLFDDIINERRLELAMEGFRFFDIVRTGKAKEVFKNLKKTNAETVYTFKDGAEVLPIPQAEVDISNGGITNN